MGDQDPGLAESPPSEPPALQSLSETEISDAVQAVSLDLVKVYVGSLPTDLEEEGLKRLLSEHDCPLAESVLVKRGYAFLELSSQGKADEIIGVLDGLEFRGCTLRAEMSVGSSSGDKKYKVLLSNVPSDTTREDLESLLKDLPSELVEVSINAETVTLTYNTKDDAEKAVNELQETEFRGQTITARLSERKSPRRSTANDRSGLNSNMMSNPRHVEFPLRILVQSDMVGAIIGRGGQTIRQITQQTRARVDVHRKDSVGSVEKAITIYGQPENCSNACLQILKVMQEEARNTEKPEDIPLKILAHNNLIGRIIGKQGSTIKRIMEETDTKITVSSINEINSFNMERIITIKGEPENICRAETEVSAKLRQAYESDLNAMAPQNVMFPGMHPAAASLVPPLGMGLAFNSPAGLHHAHHHQAHQVRLGAPATAFLGGYYTPSYNGGPGGGAQAAPGSTTKQNNGGSSAGNHNANSVPTASPAGYGLVNDPSLAASSLAMGSNMETVHMYIPNSAVGAVIGAKGSYIRDLNKYSGYSIKIASATDETTAYPAAVNATDRRVTIIGSSDRFWAVSSQ